MRLDPDPDRRLTAERRAAGIRLLASKNIAVRPRPDGPELDLILDGTDPDDARVRATAACEQMLGSTPEISSVTFVSRGTDEDALGVVAAFGLHARLERVAGEDEEIAVFTLDAVDRRRVPESRLSTALEAALNCAVRIDFR